MQANIKYNLARSFYLQTGWGMRLFYKGVKWMVDPETLEKFAIEGTADPQSLIDLYHPSQLEKRFGGKAETPSIFWPPQMTNEFLPGDESHLEQIKQEDYEEILNNNPDMIRHPDFIREVSNNTRDFFFKVE